MSEAGESTHKRTRSSALSILRRKDRSSTQGSSAPPSMTDDAPADGVPAISIARSSSGVSSTTTNNLSGAMSYQAPPSASGSIRGHGSRMSVSGASVAGRSQQAPSFYSTSPGRPSTAAPPSISITASPPSSQPTSLEQSVRKFRVVEALRNGDTASIARILRDAPGADGLDDTTVLHLAIQCAEFSVVEYVLAEGAGFVDVNARDRDGNTPLHLAAAQGRTQVVNLLLDRKDINDATANNQGRLPLDLARSPEIFQALQLSRSLFAEHKVKEVQELIASGDYKGLAGVLEETRFKTMLDINSTEFVSDPVTVQAGGTLLHEAARKKNSLLIQALLLHGADPFRRDRKGKLPQDVTKDDVTRAMLKKSPAAVAAQRGIQEKAVLGAAASGTAAYTQAASSAALGSSAGGGSLGTSASGASGGGGGGGSGSDPLAGRESREMEGYLKKWTNYRKGYQLRWFALEDGVLSYYKHQDDAGSACRGAINMRIAKLVMSPDEKTKFEIHGLHSVKYTLKANHEVEAKRWFWALNNSIQWTKDLAKEEARQAKASAERLRQAKAEKAEHALQPQPTHQSGASVAETESVDGRRSSAQARSATGRRLVTAGGGVGVGASTAGSFDDDNGDEFVDAADVEGRRGKAYGGEGGDDDRDDRDDDYDDDASSNGDRDAPSATRDALNITAQSARIQLETLASVNQALVAESARNPAATLGDAATTAALATYDAAIRSLTGLVTDIMRISRDRDAFWQYRLDREIEMRRMWEESMAQVAREQEALEARVGQAEEKKKTARRLLKDLASSGVLEEGGEAGTPGVESDAKSISLSRRQTVIEQMAELADSDSEDDEEFFDAVDAGEVPVEASLPSEPTPAVAAAEVETNATDETAATTASVVVSGVDISSSFRGYENGVRTRLKMDDDNRPKLSLWSILKSMVGKDMTKMTLPVTFNEPTSLLYRCGEDMEYVDLLDKAVERSDSIERLTYVAAFAASEYASTIGRVAKPFNPLLGETFEYVRPDKNYRFFIEQVSHHPPVGAAWAESPHWTYWGESAVKSKFYGKSFDINPLGTWFLRLRPKSGGQEDLYTWKKVTSSVIGIITGNPTVDNYGVMEIKNWTTGETAYVDFKARGWTAASAYLVSGKVVDATGRTRVSLGGRWNSKMYARMTPGYEANITDPKAGDTAGDVGTEGMADQNKVYMIWKANERPQGIPFNLTPFVLTFNHIDDQLRPWLAPTDSRLRPDQRAMEEGAYDFAATEKNRLETEQRARRRVREARGEEFVPAWFTRAKCPVTGEAYWQFTGQYWADRQRAGQGDTSVWDRLEPLFVESS